MVESQSLTDRGGGVHHSPSHPAPVLASWSPPHCTWGPGRWGCRPVPVPTPLTSQVCFCLPHLGFWFYKSTDTFQAGVMGAPELLERPLLASSLQGLSAALTPRPAPPAPPRCCRLSRWGGPQPAFLTSVQVLAGPPRSRQVIKGCQLPAHVLSGRGLLGCSPHKSPLQKGQPAAGQALGWAGRPRPRPPAGRRGGPSRPGKPPHRVLRPLLGVPVPLRGRPGAPSRDLTSLL